jgi:uncharacterized LabA/DUF88 family protein
MAQLQNRVGIYVDVENISRNGGFRMRYDVLRRFALRDDGIATRLNAYIAFDFKRSESDPVYRDRKEGYFRTLRDFGFKIIQKPVKHFVDEDGKEYSKANADLDMAVDVLLQSSKLDRVILLTGDGDFVRLVRALQDQGCRVEGLAFDHVSRDLREEVDYFFSGYLVPGLVPATRSSTIPWGEDGSFVRGTCNTFNADTKLGYFRFLKVINEHFWITDSRAENSPFETVSFHIDSFKEFKKFEELQERHRVYEFKLVPGRRTSREAIEIVEI